MSEFNDESEPEGGPKARNRNLPAHPQQIDTRVAPWKKYLMIGVTSWLMGYTVLIFINALQLGIRWYNKDTKEIGGEN